LPPARWLEIISVLRPVYNIGLVRLLAFELFDTHYLMNVRLRMLNGVVLCRHDQRLAIIQARMDGVDEMLVTGLSHIIEALESDLVSSGHDILTVIQRRLVHDPVRVLWISLVGKSLITSPFTGNIQ